MKKKYTRLVVYACSFGFTGSIIPHVPWSSLDSFGDLLAKHYDLEFINRSLPGTNNDDLFQVILSDFAENKILDDDLVIVQWSFVNRAHRNYEGSLMPSDMQPGNHAEWYYTSLFDYRIRASDLAVRCMYVQRLLPNVMFGFAEGMESIDYHVHNSIHSNLYKDCNLISYNRETLPQDLAVEFGKGILTSCLHPTNEGHRHIANRYIKEIQILMDRGDI